MLVFNPVEFLYLSIFGSVSLNPTMTPEIINCPLLL